MIRPGAVLILLVLVLAACATPTEVTSGWNRPGADRPFFDHLFVIALINDTEGREMAENALGRALNDAGVRAELSYRRLAAAGDSAEFRARVERAVKASGADGVLVVSFLKAEVRADYVPARLNQGYGPALGAGYDTVYAPGYYAENREYYLQSTLYRVGDEAPVWHAQSRVINPTSLKNAARGYASDLVARLREDGALVD